MPDNAPFVVCSIVRLLFVVASPLPACAAAPPIRLPRIVRLAGTPAQLLLAALPHAKEIKIPGEGDDGCSLLVLQDAAGKRLEWPGLQSDTLFIRPVYREFFEREDMLNCFERREVDEAPFTLVRGIPGIGKSSFALYCLWRLATAGKHVLYSYPLGLGTSAVVDFGSGPRSDAVFIADGTDGFREPAGVRLLVTSPRQDYIPEFEKHAISFYMPQPMWAELRLMRDTCFVHRAAALSDAVLEQRVLRWGRVPRFVLSHSSDEVDTLETIMRQLSVPSLRRLLLERGSTRDQQDETYRVVHYKFAHDAGDDGTYPRDSDTAAALDGGAGEATAPELYGWPLPAGTPRRVYKPAGMRWATPSMQDRMWAFFIDNMSDDRVSLLGDLFRDKAILQFSGTLWEKWASLAMARGSALGGFCIRRLTHGSDGQTAGLDADAFLGIDKQRPGMPWLLRVPPAKCADFDDLADLSAQLAVAAAQGGAAPRVRYVAPRGFASIDFLEAQLLRAASSNASVSAKHDLIVQGKQVGNGLRAIVAAAPALRPKNAAGVADEPLIHLWLVSGLVFDACEAGPLEIPPKAAPSRIAMLSPAQQITARLLNDAVDDAKALAPHVVQYAVKLPDPDAHLRAPRAADQSTSVPVPSST
jgi:hypothetical protein